MGKFEFKPHPEFSMPHNRLELSQYFLQNRIDKIIKYREKADGYLKIRANNDTINPTITDRVLKKAQESKNLRDELKVISARKFDLELSTGRIQPLVFKLVHSPLHILQVP